MKFITTLIIMFFTQHSFCQEYVKFKIIHIYKYSDGVLLRGIDSITNDTLNIISVRKRKLCLEKYEKIKIGNSYVFSIDKLPQSQAYLTDNFAIKIKTTVVWKPKDGIKNIPVVAKNTNGNYIFKELPLLKTVN